MSFSGKQILQAFILTVLLSTVGGCAMITPNLRAVAAKEFKAESERCLTAHASDQKMLPGVECLNAAMIKRDRGTANSDLTYVITTNRVVLAQKVDAGEITREEFQAQQMQLFSDAQSKLLARQNAARMSRAAEIQARNTGQPYSCTRYGNTVNCF